MTHMELAGYVRRRDNDGIGFLFRVDFGMEEAGVVPEAVQLVLDRFRVVGLRQFAHRSISFNFFTKIKTARRPKQDEACSVVPPEFAAKSRALVGP